MAYDYIEGNFSCDPIDAEGVAVFDVPICGDSIDRNVFLITLKTNDRYSDAKRMALFIVQPSATDCGEIAAFDGDAFVQGGPFRNGLKDSCGFAGGAFQDAYLWTPPISTIPPDEDHPAQDPFVLVDKGDHPAPVSGKSFSVKGKLSGFEPTYAGRVVSGRIVLFAEI